jgi:hypothetical protein
MARLRMAALASPLPWLLSALLAGLAPEAAARTPFQVRCEDGPAAGNVRFSSRDEGWRIDRSLSYRTLTQMKRPRGSGLVLGLTRTESRVAISIEGPVEPDPDGLHECLSPQIGVTLSYRPIVVYIGREFEQDSCAYREILAHEMRHVHAYVDYLPEAEATLRTVLAQRADGRLLSSRVFAPAGQSLSQLQRELDRNWMPTIRRELGKAKTLQAGIDTPREYARLSKVCQGEVQSLIRSTRRSSS